MSSTMALVHQVPVVCILDNTPDGAQARAVLIVTRPDQRQYSVPAAAFAIVLAVVAVPVPLVSAAAAQQARQGPPSMLAGKPFTSTLPSLFARTSSASLSPGPRTQVKDS
jgi:hypothetical protein